MRSGRGDGEVRAVRGWGATWTAAAVVAVCVAGCNAPASSAPPAGRSLPVETFSRVTAVPPNPPAAAEVHRVTAAELGETWRPGCPVPPAELRRVELNYIGAQGNTQRGNLVVHQDVVDDVISIFAELETLRYPIEKMQTPDHYPGAEDELSMQDNNTSAFNCRPLGTGWSQHAYGLAIDVNPLVNPYIDRGGDLQPATAGRYLDRDRPVPGMLRAGDPAVRAFTDRGWRWGGAWRNPIDYQHFEIG